MNPDPGMKEQRYGLRFDAHGIEGGGPAEFKMTLAEAEVAKAEWESRADTVGGHAEIIPEPPAPQSGGYIESLLASLREADKLLDDIDTAGDAFKPEHSPYFKYVARRCRDGDMLTRRRLLGLEGCPVGERNSPPPAPPPAPQVGGVEEPVKSGTPRTDFVENGHNPVRAMPHLCRDLERENADLRSKLEGMTQLWKRKCEFAHRLGIRINDLVRDQSNRKRGPTRYSHKVDAVIYGALTVNFTKEDWLALAAAATDQAS